MYSCSNRFLGSKFNYDMLKSGAVGLFLLWLEAKIADIISSIWTLYIDKSTQYRIREIIDSKRINMNGWLSESLVMFVSWVLGSNSQTAFILNRCAFVVRIRDGVRWGPITHSLLGRHFLAHKLTDGSLDGALCLKAIRCLFVFFFPDWGRDASSHHCPHHAMHCTTDLASDPIRGWAMSVSGFTNARLLQPIAPSIHCMHVCILLPMCIHFARDTIPPICRITWKISYTRL